MAEERCTLLYPTTIRFLSIKPREQEGEREGEGMNDRRRTKER